MQWIARSEKDTATDTLEKRPWDAACRFRLKKFEVRSPMWEVESVRQSAFGIHTAFPPEEWLNYPLTSCNDPYHDTG